MDKKKDVQPNQPDALLLGMKANNDPLLSRKEAANYLDVAARTLAIWKSTGRYNLKVVKIGRLAKYRKSDLDGFISERSIKND